MKRFYVNPAFPLSFMEIDNKKSFFSCDSISEPIQENETPSELFNKHFAKKSQE